MSITIDSEFREDELTRRRSNDPSEFEGRKQLQSSINLPSSSNSPCLLHPPFNRSKKKKSANFSSLKHNNLNVFCLNGLGPVQKKMKY